MTKIKIVYGTGGGNTEIVCERAKEKFEEHSHSVELIRAKTAKPEDMLGAELLILACPTYGHGILETFMGKLVAKSKDIDLKGQQSVIIGLGDATYDIDYFIESEKILRAFLQEHEAEIICNPLMVSRSPIPYLDTYIPRWVDQVCEKL
jgi:flavodoxin